MKKQKKYKNLKKRLDQLEAIVKTNSVTLTDPNDEKNKVVMKINDAGNFECFYQKTTTTTEKEQIINDTNL